MHTLLGFLLALLVRFLVVTLARIVLRLSGDLTLTKAQRVEVFGNIVRRECLDQPPLLQLECSLAITLSRSTRLKFPLNASFKVTVRRLNELVEGIQIGINHLLAGGVLAQDGALLLAERHQTTRRTKAGSHWRLDPLGRVALSRALQRPNVGVTVLTGARIHSTDLVAPLQVGDVEVDLLLAHNLLRLVVPADDLLVTTRR